MIRPDSPYGFRVVGPVTEGRRLVDAAAAFSAHCAADPRSEPNAEAYLSAFHYGADFQQLLRERGSPKGFAGPCWSPWLWFDLDRPGDPEAALSDARKLAGFVLDRYRQLDEDDLLVFFSGAKGFHLGLPLAHNPPPSVLFHRTARHLAERLAAGAGVRIDTSVYDRVRCFRAPNSRHPRTGYHKRRVSHSELMNLSVARVTELAREPLPFDIPRIGELISELEADWEDAAAAGRERTVMAGSDHPGRLQRATIDFLHSGAEEGERHPRLFRAAADMAELAAVRGVDALIRAVLTEPALDTGLPPGEVDRQIGCGIDHGRRVATGAGGAA
ncbi:DNA primase [Fimbriiglobus ruber]|uniref:Phage protein n=1 Tax=Fimbriiglobus ruber TaxID=1908690 RepID=A0A225E6G8_9BACT|nr:DNA primase [Fimbriiglobus ruber]OWK44027.1 Phage protein [Fimbriiglobus ruber]